MIKHELRHHQPRLVRIKPHQSPPLFYFFFLKIRSDSIPVLITSQSVSIMEMRKRQQLLFPFFVALVRQNQADAVPARTDDWLWADEGSARLMSRAAKQRRARSADQKPHCFSRPAHSCASQGASVFSISPLSQAAAMEGSMGRRETEGMPCFSAIFSIWLSPKML